MSKQEVPIEALNKWYREIAEVTSVEISRRLYHHFQGITINFPMRFTSTEYLKTVLYNHIQREGFLTKREIQTYATHFHYSERHIQRLLKEVGAVEIEKEE